MTIASRLAGDDQVDVGLRAIGERRVGDELAVDAADADAGERAGPRDVGEVQRGDAPVSASTSVGFSLSVEMTVAMTCVSNAPALGEERARRAIDEAAGEDFVLRQPPLALEEAAGDLAGREVFSRYSQVSGKKSTPGRSSTTRRR